MIGGTNAYKHTPIVSRRNPESTGSFPPEIISPAVITANANPTIAVRIDRRCIISNELLYSLILNSRCYSDVTIYELTDVYVSHLVDDSNTDRCPPNTS